METHIALILVILAISVVITTEVNARSVSLDHLIRCSSSSCLRRFFGVLKQERQKRKREWRQDKMKETAGRQKRRMAWKLMRLKEREERKREY